MPNAPFVLHPRDAAANAAALAIVLGRAGAGDRSAFEDVYRRTSAKLFSVCLHILHDRAEAEEALQEVYLIVWRRAASFDPDRGAAMTWLITLARNRAVDRLRQTKPVATLPIDASEAIADAAPSTTDRIDAGFEALRLAECISRLDHAESAMIRAAFFEGSTYAELAVRGAIPLGTLKSRVRRALLRLRECLR